MYTTIGTCNPGYDQVSGSIYKWLNIINVGPKTSETITVRVTVNAYTADGTFLRNTATLYYEDANGNPYPIENDTADVTVTAPDMTIIKSSDVTTADPSDLITYTILYNNTGTGEATDLVIVDKIPADTIFVSASPNYTSRSDDIFTWNFASISGETDGEITIVVRVDAYHSYSPCNHIH
jgi:uncharacterized repeat protein (TIGR01451 family)